MSRLSLLAVLLLSFALMGATTCRFSSGDSKHDKDDKGRSGSGVQVVVEPRIPDSTGGSAAGPAPGRVVAAALATSVLPGPPAAATAPAPVRLTTVEVAYLSAFTRAPARYGAGGAIPEPGAGLLFAAGLGALAWRLRRGRPVRPPALR